MTSRRNRRMLERPTESEVGSLLLQVRSPSYRASACQVDGLDGKRSPSQRYSGGVAPGLLCCRSNNHQRHRA